MPILLNICILVTVAPKVLTTIVVEDNGVNWLSASRFCDENGNDLEHDSSVLSNIDKLGNHEFWIGIILYNELTPWIELIGCCNLNNNQSHHITSNSIGYCQQHCQSWLYFGYKSSTRDCRCLSLDDFNYYHNLYVSDCHFSTDNVTRIYQRLNYNKTDGDGEENKCMVLKCVDQRVFQYPWLCSFQNTSMQTLCNGFEKPPNQSWTLNYTMAQKACFQQNQTLISPHGCHKNVTGIAWTSVFREDIIIEYYKEVKGQTPVACLSGQRSNNSEQNNILLRQRQCNDTLEYFVCRSNVTGDHTTPHFTHPEHDTIVTMTSDNLEITQKQNTSNVTDKNMNTVISSDTTKTGALVGGLVGGIISVALGILLFLGIRRINYKQAPKSKGIYVSSTHLPSNNITHVSNMQYGVVETTVSSANEYADVKNGHKLNKPIPKYDVIQREKITTSPGDIFVVAAEGEYDKLNNVTSRKIINDGNVYEIAGRQCKEGEYDTMNGMLESNVQSVDDLYDTNVSVCN